jgi:hypothetical protein
MLHAGRASHVVDESVDSELMDLDEAANITNEGGDDEDGNNEEGLEEFGAGLNFGHRPLAKLLAMSLLERLKWHAGFPLPVTEIAQRIMMTLDAERSGSLPLTAVDFLLKQLQGELPLSKETFDLAEVLLSLHSCAFICCPSVSPAFLAAYDDCG